jgi:hypothetical protein
LELKELSQTKDRRKKWLQKQNPPLSKQGWEKIAMKKKNCT